MATEFSVSTIIKAVDRASAPLRQVAKSAEQVQRSFRGVARAGESMTRASRALSTRLTLPILGVGAASINAAADMETMTVAFESMLGSGEAATRMMEQLSNFTATTPFQLEGVAASAKQLLAFGVSAEDMTDTLQVLGDIASGANVPLRDMAAIYGKIKAKGKAMTEELMQLSDRGIPIIAVLAEQYGVAEDAVFDLASQGEISFADMEQAMNTMTSEGGIFFEQMIKQSTTFNGLMSTLGDNVTLTLGKIGMNLIEVLNLKPAIVSLTEKIALFGEKLGAFAEANPGITKFVVVMGLVLAALAPVLFILGQLFIAVAALSPAIVLLTGKFGLLAISSKVLGLSLKLLGKSVVFASKMFVRFAAILLTNPIILIATAIAAAAMLIITHWEPIAAFFQDKFNTIRNAFDQGIVQGILTLLAEFNPVLLLMQAFDGLIQWLFGVDLSEGVGKIIDTFIAPLKNLGSKIVDLLPDWLTDMIGITVDGQVPQAAGTGFSAGAVGRQMIGQMTAEQEQQMIDAINAGRLDPGQLGIQVQVDQEGRVVGVGVDATDAPGVGDVGVSNPIP